MKVHLMKDFLFCYSLIFFYCAHVRLNSCWRTIGGAPTTV
jgi:hypothetical protein